MGVLGVPVFGFLGCLVSGYGSLIVNRVEIDQQKACYHKPYNRELVCQCGQGQDMAFLMLKPEQFIKHAGQQVLRQQYAAKKSLRLTLKRKTSWKRAMLYDLG